MSTAARDVKQSTICAESVFDGPITDPNGSKYDDQQRIDAAIMYAHKGSFSATSREVGIPRQTICTWKDCEWWDRVVSEVRQQKNDLYVAKYGDIIEQAVDIVQEKLPESSARDAMIIAATANDKLRLALNQPTSIRGDSDSIKSLAAEFAKLSQDHKNIQDSVVSTQEKRD
jgi:hypothetical protein